ncbi:MAG: LptF/LptG family permease [Steroidobacteraceae bacterium]
MTRVLGPYLRKRVAVSIIGLLAALTGLMQLLELLDVTTDVLNRNLGVTGIVHYAVLRLPGEMAVALPLAALLGSMSAFYAMARSREITALRSAGIGLRRILVYLIPVPIVLAVVQLALSQYLVPLSEQSLKSWWDSTIPLEERPAQPRWVHTSNGVLKFERNSSDGRTLLDVGLYTRGAEGLLQLRTRARRADWAGNDWLLRGVTELAISGTAPPVDRERTRHWSSNLRPEDILQLDVADPHMSGTVLADVIVGERVSTRPRSYYEAVLARSFTAPLAAFIMLLLALPSAIMSERRGGGGRLLVALALGLGFLLVDGILASFGTSGRIAPWWSAAIAPLLFATIGFWQLFSCEHS